MLSDQSTTRTVGQSGVEDARWGEDGVRQGQVGAVEGDAGYVDVTSCWNALMGKC